ncbi:uncharacterized protein TrAtP1_005759 [Trichoderma atroviride]|uniref:uncharacterized protein n=1 Tax=Hypocrea atroviridis TaxID=63577 RepID=UPI00331FE89B|nr:hypothetical protein TrAtP1_005759 [Trichoderma atroviride]
MVLHLSPRSRLTVHTRVLASSPITDPRDGTQLKAGAQRHRVTDQDTEIELAHLQSKSAPRVRERPSMSIHADSGQGSSSLATILAREQ